MKRYRFIDHGLNCEVYVPRQYNKNKSAVYLYGFPGSVGPNVTIELLCKNGYTVFSPNYRGTYDSSGEHTPLTAIESVKELVAIIGTGAFTDIKSLKKIVIPQQVEVMAAASFGCLIALNALSFFPQVRVLLLIAPAITFAVSGESYCGLLEDGIENFRYVLRSRPHTYRLGPEGEWQRLFKGEFDGLYTQQHPALCYVRGIVGDNDGTFDLSFLQQHFERIIRNVVGSVPDVVLETVGMGSHSAETLLTERITKDITTLL